MKVPAFIIAGVSSSVGKTVITLGIMEALRKRGVTVQPFKAGPDYIDAAFHTAALKRPSYNLDTWMMGPDGVKKTFRRRSQGADISVIEGVMGLFDGYDGGSDEGSTAHLAKLLKIPVILVVNAEKTARSIGAIVKGFQDFDKSVCVKWVIFNRVASPRHLKILADSLADNPVKILGYIPQDEKFSLPHRHLGLVTHGDLRKGEWKRFIKKAADVVDKNIDLESLMDKGQARILPARNPRPPFRPESSGNTAKKTRIAVALDNAFCFYYRENLDILERSGAELVFFSPIKDKRLPAGIGGIYIGGGYPELYAGALESNISLRREVKRLAQAGQPVFAECGGLMYLGSALKGKDGSNFAMAGVFPWTARMLPKRKALGYREVKALEGCPFLKKGASLKGHEFHYSELLKEPPAGVRRVFKVVSGQREESYEGYLYRNTLASYVHIHFASNPAFAEGFVELCKGA